MPKTVRSCEIVTRLENDDGEMLFDLDNLSQVLNDKGNCIKEYAYIIHDKDKYTHSDEKRNPEHKEGTLKPKHIHLILRFNRNQPQQFSSIAKWFDIPENFVSKIHGSFADGVMYLIHANAPDKFQYDIEEVTSNFNVQTIIEHEKDKNKLDDILQKILSGEIREYNKTIEIDNLLLVYQTRKINEAFKIRSEYLQATQKDRNTTVIYITGTSGAGKTTLAKMIAKENNLDYFISSGSRDIMDGYCQQPCLICDDIRPSCLGLSDLLKMLDPHTASSVNSRYKNKFLNAELIILTSVLPIDEFYHNVFENENEPITQLKRRCKLYVSMDKKTIKIRQWDDVIMMYLESIEYENFIIRQYDLEKMIDTESPREKIEKLFPFLIGKEVNRQGTSINSIEDENTFAGFNSDDISDLLKGEV